MYQKTELIGKDKKDGFKVWSIEVMLNEEEPDLGACIIIKHGKEGGKITEKSEYIYEGKQGRSEWEQAVLQAEARIKKQRDKGYRDSKEELEEVPLLAMLAADASKKPHLIRYENGVFGSVKFDGMRAMAKCIDKGVVTLETRTGQPIELDRITNELAEYMQAGDVLDGELYLHGEVLQDIVSAIKRTDCEDKIEKAYKKMGKAIDKYGKDSDEYYAAAQEWEDAQDIAYIRQFMEFHVFDLPTSKSPFDMRHLEMYDYRDMNGLYGNAIIKFVDYEFLKDEFHKYGAHKRAVDQGYEGLMLRNAAGVYESGKRSNDLLKYKEFMYEEFKVLDVIPDKQDGCRFVVLNNINSETFEVVMGTMAEREEYLANKELYIGRWILVQFQSRYKKTLKPQFPTGKMFREGTEVNGEFIPAE